MQIRAAVLCDFARVRSGLLTIVGAGISRIDTSVFPAALPVFLAIVIDPSPDEIARGSCFDH